MLAEVKAAPLKPYQRLAVLRDFLIPGLIHGLVLGDAHRNTLRRMDRLIRSSVRAWLRLPKDTSLGLLHSSAKQGGLNIPCLESSIPIAQKSRFKKLLMNADSLIQAVTYTKAFRVILRKTDIPIRVGNAPVLSTADAKDEWARKLFSSYDGKELSEPDIDEGSHGWLRNPERVFPRLFIRGIQLRGGTWASKARASRGRPTPEEDRKCRWDVRTLSP